MRTRIAKSLVIRVLETNSHSAIPTPQFLAVAPANIQSFFSTYGATNVGTVISNTTNAQAGAAIKSTTGLLYNNLPATLPIFSKVAFTAPNDAGGGVPQNTYNIVGRVDYNLGSFYYGPGNSLPEQIRNGNVLTVPNSPIGKLWNPQYGTVSPRISFAYDLFGNGKTSLRGGYGISYGNVTFNVIQNPPNYAVVVLRSNTANTYAVTNSNSGPLQGTGQVALPPTSLRHVDQNIRTAQTQFHSLSIDQQLGRGTLVSLSYNGSRGINLYDIKNYNIAGMGNLYLGDPLVDPNPPAGTKPNSALTYNNPHFSNDNNRGSNGDSYYNPVNVQFTTNDVRHSGLSVVANYNYAHSLDDLSSTFSETGAQENVGGLGYMNAFDPGLDHGSSDFDIRHRLVLAPIYRTPSFFRDKGKARAQLFGGYEVTGIYTVRTGTPFTFSDFTNNNSGYGLVRYNPVTPNFQHTLRTSQLEPQTLVTTTRSPEPTRCRSMYLSVTRHSRFLERFQVVSPISAHIRVR